MKNNKIMKTVILIVVLLIPIIYSFFYLKSYWDPYGDLTGMKIAVVNLDEGENEENQGTEFINGLKESATFDICEVSLDTANKGMQNGDYYATITIPSNFTNCLNSVATKDKQMATITYSPNQASNYLASQIINSAVKTMETNLQAKVDSKIVETLAHKLEGVPESLQKVSDGADKILEGSEGLNSGLSQINDGTTILNKSYTEFDNGVTSAYEGSQSIDNGIEQVNSGVNSLSEGSKSLDTAISQINFGVDELQSQGNAGIEVLGTGISSLNAGAETLNTGVANYVDGTTLLANGAKNYVTGATNYTEKVDNYVDQVNTVLNLLSQNADEATKEKLQQLIAGGNAVKTGGTQLTSNNNTLTTGANTLLAAGDTVKQGATSVYQGTQELAKGSSGLTGITDGIKNLKTALAKVKTGTETLNTGVNTLGKGTNELKTGSTNLGTGLLKLSNSSKDVKNALETLNGGTNSAYQGSTQLVDGVQTFKNEVNKGIEETNEQLETLDGIAEFAEDPVEIKTEPYGEVSSYGIAFTPLFLCIGLWVGALMSYVVLYYDQKNRFEKLGSNNKHKLLQNALYILIGAVQGFITGALLKVGLGYEVENIALYYLSSVLIGITFTSIIQFLIRNFGDIGKFVALIVLVLQLAASGGTFPVETINKSFQAISPYLPMTYSIKLLREILVPTASNFKGKYIVILIGITAITLIITYIVDIKKKQKKREY